MKTGLLVGRLSNYMEGHRIKALSLILPVVLSGGISQADLPRSVSVAANTTIAPIPTATTSAVQKADPIKIKTSSIKENAPTGKLLVVVFKDGLPAADIVVKASGQVLKTNSAGVASLELPAKTEAKIDIPVVGKTFSVPITADQESQVTVTLLSDSNSDVNIESPEAESATTAITSDAKKETITFKVLGPGEKPLPEVTLLLSGVNSVYKTDAQGMLKVDLPAGKYAMSFFHPQYQTRTMADFRIEGPLTETQIISLAPATNQLEEVLVLAPKIKGSLSSLVEVRKQSSAVTDVLGAEQMARAGDSDAAASLRRVTGLTLVGGKYVYVRGLGERYSGVQMNQFSLPSPEPSRRVVPLDLFPTAIMESIIVQKSYSPDLPGEFGGGIIQLRTRSLPEKFFIRGNITANQENTSNRLAQQGGSKDWLGMDDGTRALPGPIKEVLGKGLQLKKTQFAGDKGISEAELNALSRTLPANYNTTNESNPSMPGLSVSMGSGWKFSNFKVGTSGSALYGQSTEQITRTSNSFNIGAGGKMEKDSTRSTDSAEVETRLAGSLDLGVEMFKSHKIIASTFLLRNTTNLAQLNNTTNLNSGNATEATTLDFTERQLWTQHLKGEHQIEKIPLKIDWRLGHSEAKRDSPDRREYTYDILQGNRSLASDQAGNQRTYSNLGDTTNEMAFDLTLPVVKNDREWVKFKVGMQEIKKERQSDVTRLFFKNTLTNSNTIDFSQKPDTIFALDNRNPDTLQIQNLTNAADSYSAEQTIRGQYAMMEINPHPKWTLQAGLRQEKSIQQVNTFYYFDPSKPFATSNLEMNDRLPAYSLTWKPTEALRARLAYSETLARPDFRELSTVGFIDDETRYQVLGNANLKGTVIKNIDHRWEYYFTADEYASIGAFYKKFKNPIEVMFLAGPNNIQTYDNAVEANNFGIELEGRMGLRHTTRYLRRWSVISNLTLIRSDIVLDERSKGIQTSGSRPLQGQSPYVFNAQLQYDRPVWGFSATLLYNIIGKRITEVGTNQIPDTYEQPFGQLDFVSSLAIQKNWTLGIRARNLLDPTVESTQGPEVVRSQKRGRVFALVLGAVF